MPTKTNTSNFSDAIQHLSDCDPDWAKLIGRVGPCGLTQKDQREPYQALLSAVAHQQLHGRAAEAILKRFYALYPNNAFPTPAQVLKSSDEDLRACGFSSNKITCIKGIAENALTGVIPSYQEAQTLNDEALITRLTPLRGIGRWTVEMLLMFTLDRPDVLPVDDFGVREGWRVLKGLEKQPTPKMLKTIGEAWKPYRSVAAWYLWRAADLAKKVSA